MSWEIGQPVRQGAVKQSMSGTPPGTLAEGSLRSGLRYSGFTSESAWILVTASSDTPENGLPSRSANSPAIWLMRS